MNFVVFFLVAAAGGLAQAVSGFGSGILMMVALPFFYTMNVAPAISNAVAVPVTLALGLRFRKSVSVKKLLLPWVFYIAVSSLAIRVSSLVSMDRYKIIFGLLLVGIAIYSLCTGGKLRVKGGPLFAIFCSVFSGFMSGFFSIGGPFMVLYFLSVTDSKEEYLGCVNCFMAVTTLYQLILRIALGVTTVNLLPIILVGIVGIGLGCLVGMKIVDRINGERLKKIINIFLVAAGLLTVFESLAP